MPYKNILITGTGSYVPPEVITNNAFAGNEFYDLGGVPFDISHEEIAQKFHAITGIKERRYVRPDQRSSDIGAIAAAEAIADAGIDKEEIDHIIVAHNFGDILNDTIQTDIVPSLGTRIKHLLGIKDPSCVAYDLIFGCPGWIQGIIQASSFMQTGLAKKCLIIGTETLSRVTDMHDRDSMIYADGAGACVLELKEGEEQYGVLSSTMSSHTADEAYYLYMGKSNMGKADPKIRYIKMHGRKIYEFALTHVPSAMKACMEKAGADIQDVRKIFIHQANEKLDFEVIKRFYRLYKIREVPDGIMPMSIHELGNSSVATVPTLFDRVRKGTLNEHHDLNDGDLLLFASVGAGMNVNCVAYRYQNV